MIQSWVDWMYSDGMLTSAVNQYLSRIRRLLHHGIRYHFEDFGEPLVLKPRIREELHALTLEEIRRIFSVAGHAKRWFYLALISTGARPGELLQVRKRDIDFSGKRVRIRIEAENVDTLWQVGM